MSYKLTNSQKHDAGVQFARVVDAQVGNAILTHAGRGHDKYDVYNLLFRTGNLAHHPRSAPDPFTTFLSGDTLTMLMLLMKLVQRKMTHDEWEQAMRWHNPVAIRLMLTHTAETWLFSPTPWEAYAMPYFASDAVMPMPAVPRAPARPQPQQQQQQQPLTASAERIAAVVRMANQMMDAKNSIHQVPVIARPKDVVAIQQLVIDKYEGEYRLFHDNNLGVAHPLAHFLESYSAFGDAATRGKPPKRVTAINGELMQKLQHATTATLIRFMAKAMGMNEAHVLVHQAAAGTSLAYHLQAFLDAEKNAGLQYAAAEADPIEKTVSSFMMVLLAGADDKLVEFIMPLAIEMARFVDNQQLYSYLCAHIMVGDIGVIVPAGGRSSVHLSVVAHAFRMFVHMRTGRLIQPTTPPDPLAADMKTDGIIPYLNSAAGVVAGLQSHTVGLTQENRLALFQLQPTKLDFLSTNILTPTNAFYAVFVAVSTRMAINQNKADVLQMQHAFLSSGPSRYDQPSQQQQQQQPKEEPSFDGSRAQGENDDEVQILEPFTAGAPMLALEADTPEQRRRVIAAATEARLAALLPPAPQRRSDSDRLPSRKPVAVLDATALGAPASAAVDATAAAAPASAAAAAAAPADADQKYTIDSGAQTNQTGGRGTTDSAQIGSDAAPASQPQTAAAAAAAAPSATDGIAQQLQALSDAIAQTRSSIGAPAQQQQQRGVPALTPAPPLRRPIAFGDRAVKVESVLPSAAEPVTLARYRSARPALLPHDGASAEEGRVEHLAMPLLEADESLLQSSVAAEAKAMTEAPLAQSIRLMRSVAQDEKVPFGDELKNHWVLPLAAVVNGSVKTAPVFTGAWMTTANNAAFAYCMSMLADKRYRRSLHVRYAAWFAGTALYTKSGAVNRQELITKSLQLFKEIDMFNYISGNERLVSATLLAYGYMQSARVERGSADHATEKELDSIMQTLLAIPQLAPGHPAPASTGAPGHTAPARASAARKDKPQAVDAALAERGETPLEVTYRDALAATERKNQTREEVVRDHWRGTSESAAAFMHVYFSQLAALKLMMEQETWEHDYARFMSFFEWMAMAPEEAKGRMGAEFGEIAVFAPFTKIISTRLDVQLQYALRDVITNIRRKHGNNKHAATDAVNTFTYRIHLLARLINTFNTNTRDAANQFNSLFTRAQNGSQALAMAHEAEESVSSSAGKARKSRDKARKSASRKSADVSGAAANELIVSVDKPRDGDVARSGDVAGDAQMRASVVADEQKAPEAGPNNTKKRQRKTNKKASKSSDTAPRLKAEPQAPAAAAAAAAAPVPAPLVPLAQVAAKPKSRAKRLSASVEYGRQGTRARKQPANFAQESYRREEEAKAKRAAQRLVKKEAEKNKTKR
jgi:hypothetical protein